MIFALLSFGLQGFMNAPPGLGITSPWYIEGIDFDLEMKRLNIHINFKRGAVFPSADPAFEGEYKAFDTKEKTWRHLSFFERAK